MRRIYIGVATCALFLVLIGSGCQAQKDSVDAGVQVFWVRPFLQNAGKTNMTIRWISDVKGGVVSYGPADRMDGRSEPSDCREISYAVSLPPDSNGEVKSVSVKLFIQSAHLCNLLPGTSYKYEVAVAGDKAGGVFRTAPGGSEKFCFAAYGDSRSDPESHKSVASRFKATGAAFVINTGDLVSGGAYFEWKPEFFDPLADVICDIPVWPSQGNHDGNFQNIFALPDNKSWYSFDYGNAHFVCLNSCAAVSNMVDWCERDLAASTSTWKIVYYHHPSYDLGSHRSAWGRANILPVLRKHKVDLVLTGHTHGYQRFRPMFTRGENGKNPITHIVTAGGGAPLYGDVPANTYLAKSANEFHYTLVTVDGARISVSAISSGGRTLDSFSYTKKDGVVESDWISRALPEDDFDKE